jgi:hypothetical protein
MFNPFVDYKRKIMTQKNNAEKLFSCNIISTDKLKKK